ncbi:MAG: magnesium and cobalt transport protein CorA [Micrococcales bacterium]|nr:magnesium and cobalt transport protein CorA [Micrococcales bacterium]
MIVDQALYEDGRRLPCPDLSLELRRIRDERRTGSFIWIGMKDPGTQELLDVGAELGLHPLAIEDATEGANQRAKIERYEGTFAAVVKTVRYIDATSDIETGELMVFVGDRFVVTVRRGEANELHGVRGRLEADAHRLALGPTAALHAIVDSVVDNYTAVDIELQKDLEQIEELVFSETPRVNTTDIYRLKREVLEFKRAALPLVSPVSVLQGKQSPLEREVRLLFRDVYDHLNLVADHLHSYDALLTDILGAHLGRMSMLQNEEMARQNDEMRKQNEDMRKISAWVAIAAVPTMLAGVYGMNFDHMPELHWEYGYFILVGVMVAACLTLFALFKKNDWL